MTDGTNGDDPTIEGPSDDETRGEPPTEGADTSYPPSGGTEVAGYRLIRKLGEGGMGVVWEAEQEHPVRRKVALKLVKTGVESERILGRFEAERQALAVMSHENIARVFDAGTTSDGRPYFVMEHVEGVPIDAYCDRERLDMRARLDLVLQLCDGVQHAHQKGIIHRDLKPSNVLVTLQGDRPVVKIIDFGIAKAIESPLMERTQFTEYGMVVGTPEYMSPEQAEGNPNAVDTRTDLYAIGVTLYQLLTGALPFDSRELRRAAFAEMMRVIREETPPRPSTRVGTLGETTEEIATNRRTRPPALVRELKGDLDWITMKALEKEPHRRYAAVSDLAADLKRHLANQPVAAGPPSAAYKMRKFVKRHTVGVAASLALLVALVLGAIGTTVGMVRAVRAEGVARREAATSQRVADFLVGVFKVSEPNEARGRSVTAWELLQNAMTKIRGDLKEEPAVKARLMETMGLALRSLGLYGDSKGLLQDSLDIRRGLPDGSKKDLAGNMSSLAGTLILAGDYKGAVPVLEEARSIQDQALAPADPERARVLNNLGSAYARLGDTDKALTSQLEALAIREKAFGKDSVEIAGTLVNLGNLYRTMKRYDDAQAVLGRALAIREKNLDPKHPDIASVLVTLGLVEVETGHGQEAVAHLERALALREGVLPPEHTDLARTHNALARALASVKRGDEARRHELEAIAIVERGVGFSHPDGDTIAKAVVEVLKSVGDDAGAAAVEAKRVIKK
ncbi:MAG TPA: serine/threonine-protein kinase [Candidatus Polarisedimenticolaceae bacterium]|nr:serine/threonine-protein kinase [Candidatus Polarisedimenticolaceae bacterium]